MFIGSSCPAGQYHSMQHLRQFSIGSLPNTFWHHEGWLSGGSFRPSSNLISLRSAARTSGNIGNWALPPSSATNSSSNHCLYCLENLRGLADQQLIGRELILALEFSLITYGSFILTHKVPMFFCFVLF